VDIQVINSSISLIRHIFDSRTSTVPRIETVPEKPAFIDRPIGSPFPRATPESRGIPSGLLADYFRALAENKTLDMHSVTVVRDGAVVAETDFGAHDRRVWHITYSACKSITGLAVGMLVDEGKLALSDKVIKLLEARAPRLSLLTMKDLTVSHLLTMTSGVGFNESGAVTETDWVRGYLESTLHGEPGTKFNYNSMNTYMLSAIVREVSGQNLTEYLRPRLWEPLDISEVFWETCPMGIDKGGWGLYIRQEDFAKIGQLVLQGGEWNGKRLVSREWIDAATSLQVKTPASYGDYNYGYQTWVSRRGDAFLFNGMFGQNILGYKDSGIIVAVNAGIDELFQHSDFYTITGKFFGRAFEKSLPEDEKARRELQNLLDSLDAKKAGKTAKRGFMRKDKGLPEECAALDGKKYYVHSPNRASVGLMPLLMQAFQNIYTKGVVSLAFSAEAEKFFMTVEEGDGSYKLPVGFGTPEYTELNLYGEPHRVGVLGRFARDEDDRAVLIPPYPLSNLRAPGISGCISSRATARSRGAGGKRRPPFPQRRPRQADGGEKSHSDRGRADRKGGAGLCAV
jgi:CubicO group peptidase (beta-lactamase class C family)